MYYNVTLVHRKTKSFQWNESVYTDYIEGVFIRNTRSDTHA